MSIPSRTHSFLEIEKKNFLSFRSNSIDLVFCLSTERAETKARKHQTTGITGPIPFPLTTLSTPSILLVVNTDGLADSIKDHIR